MNTDKEQYIKKLEKENEKLKKEIKRLKERLRYSNYSDDYWRDFK